MLDMCHTAARPGKPLARGEPACTYPDAWCMPSACTVLSPPSPACRNRALCSQDGLHSGVTAFLEDVAHCDGGGQPALPARAGGGGAQTIAAQARLLQCAFLRLTS